MPEINSVPNKYDQTIERLASFYLAHKSNLTNTLSCESAFEACKANPLFKELTDQVDNEVNGLTGFQVECAFIMFKEQV